MSKDLNGMNKGHLNVNKAWSGSTLQSPSSQGTSTKKVRDATINSDGRDFIHFPTYFRPNRKKCPGTENCMLCTGTNWTKKRWCQNIKVGEHLDACRKPQWIWLKKIIAAVLFLRGATSQRRWIKNLMQYQAILCIQKATILQVAPACQASHFSCTSLGSSTYRQHLSQLLHFEPQDASLEEVPCHRSLSSGSYLVCCKTLDSFSQAPKSN